MDITGSARRVLRGLRRRADRIRERQWLAFGHRCAVCNESVRVVDVTRAARPTKTCRLEICGHCGHVSNPRNLYDYSRYRAVDELPMRPRIGTVDRTGREFFMAQMAIDILGRRDLDVLVYGAGRSLDNHHIARLPGVRSVAIADIMRLRDDAEFYDSRQPAPRRFPVVIASEVVEHFLNPREDFERLFAFVEPDGMLVCSTNLYDGRNLRRQNYLFLPGHVSYYTPASLAEIARANGWSMDLRVPVIATGRGGPRKRYALFTTSPTVQASIAEYFRDRQYAPSEPP